MEVLEAVSVEHEPPEVKSVKPLIRTPSGANVTVSIVTGTRKSESMGLK